MFHRQRPMGLFYWHITRPDGPEAAESLQLAIGEIGKLGRLWVLAP
jgi:hypothetical protein